MYRKCIKRLTAWAQRQQRGAMVLRGARQVGKTTLVRMLAKQCELTLVELNLEEPQTFTDLLKSRNAAKDILELILLEQGINKPPNEVLIFFDEAQALPELYPYLRYFTEKAPEYRVIAAGSLFDFSIKRQDNAQGPTGRVEYSYLEPMSFEEYLMAKNQPAYEKLTSLSLNQPISESVHQILTKLFREYLICGGMPAAVKASIAGEGPLRLDEIKTDIVTGYILDLPKYSNLNNKDYNSELLENLYKTILARPANSMKYSELAPSFRAEVVRKHLDIMLDARIIRQSIHSGENKVPLSVGANKKSYKLYSLDLGLCYSYSKLPIAEIYTSEDINDVARGTLAEQYVAQTLAALQPYHQQHDLYHWQNKKKNAQSEVDFVLAINGMVIPIECKSGYSTKLKSLHILLTEKHYPMALRLYAGNVKREIIEKTVAGGKTHKTELVSLPHYMLERFANSIHA